MGKAGTTSQPLQDAAEIPFGVAAGERQHLPREGVISGNEAFSGRPALNPQPDGALAVSAQYNDSDVWASSQTATTGPQGRSASTAGLG